MHTTIRPNGAADAIGPFSQGVIASGRTLYVSGQGPQNPATNGFELGDFETEVRLTLDNLTRVLTGAGTDWSTVVRVGVYLSRMADFAAFNAIYADYAREPYPARTTVICELLAGIAVEVDCIAVLP